MAIHLQTREGSKKTKSGTTDEKASLAEIRLTCLKITGHLLFPKRHRRLQPEHLNRLKNRNLLVTRHGQVFAHINLIDLRVIHGLSL